MNVNGQVRRVDVLPQHKFDEQRLAAYLSEHLPWLGTEIEISQFLNNPRNGQNNWKRQSCRRMPPIKPRAISWQT